MLSVVNIAAYRFVQLQDKSLMSLQILFKAECLRLNIKGTILLSMEGINLFLAGRRADITEFQGLLNSFSYFKSLVFRESFSNLQPFKRMLVKIKKEIIPFGVDLMQYKSPAAPTISPETLKKWLEKNSRIVLLDARNSFEVKLGSFKNSLHLGLRHFRDFPKSVQKLHNIIENVPIVTFCTGGIRCEKASALLLQSGFKQVYQLDGGILNYFAKCGGDHYTGLCFVFDARRALTPSLEAIDDERFHFEQS